MDRANPSVPAEGWTRYLLPVPLLLSGFCGISYEILYAKLFGNLLGNQFTINASVLLTFLLGIGWGTLYAHRFRGYLWAIESGIGAYAAFMALAYDGIDSVLFRALPSLGTNGLATALVCVVLLLTPAFLIGCSIPLFAGYFVHLKDSRAFSLTYGIYNVGAALTALLLEFALLRRVGLRDATILLAGLNGVVALGVVIATRSMPQAASLPPGDRIRFPRRMLLALAVASVGSAIFQLLMMKLATFVLGPYNETFALVLAIVLLGISLGSFGAGRFGWTFEQVLLIAGGGVAAVLLLFPIITLGYAAAYLWAAEHYLTLVALKFALVFSITALPAIGFGATIPALLPKHRQVARESGQLLFVSSMGNVVGFALMAFVLHRLLDYGPLLVLVAALAVGAILLAHERSRSALLLAPGLVVLTLVALQTTWNEGLLYLGYTEFQTVEDLEAAQRTMTAEERFKGPQDVFAITRYSGEPFFFINGYVSIPLANPQEKMVGALGAMLSPRVDRALVLGLGSGATAGTVGLLFDRTDVAEINRVVIDHQHLMAEYNFDILHQPGVNIVHDDGIHFIKARHEPYSLILNTVETPLYFSSSKLYTRDFFELVKRRLAPDGVYLTWVDGRIGDRGIDVILGTLEQSFRHCALSYMNAAYFQLICSEEPVSLRQYDAVVGNARLRELFAEKYEMPVRFFAYTLLAQDAFKFRSNDPPRVNTLDNPVLEFEMTRLRRGGIPLFGQRLTDRWELSDSRAVVADALEWNPAELSLLATLQLEATSPLARLIEARVANVPLGLDEAALVAAREIGDADGYSRYARILLDRGRFSASIEAYTELLALEPERDNAHYRLARAYRGAGDYERAYEHLLAEWDLDRDDDVPLLAGMTLADAGRWEEALPWLDAAQVLPPPKKPQDIAYYRGVAYEGLNDVAEARRQYLAVLTHDDSHLKARQALARMDAPVQP